ncbi:lipase member H-like [Frankliniella occidentalis]|uniref:Lipase member H-like n=1 Tax=Frankliniella occidentalis TaxID=133901 RepID=A0A9C6U0I7_FRAOC|nr:lipase member H-like [Frankliniella occidentalis]XP_052120839.1 lipase member H-like [Frankliniella occidentalis]XP_052120842.1 lipase member H-like [Frankliniella occidentalis]
MDLSRAPRASVLAMLAVLAGLPGPADLAAGGWSAGYFNTLYGPAVDPGGLVEPHTSLSPPPAWSGYSAGYSSAGSSSAGYSSVGFSTRAYNKPEQGYSTGVYSSGGYSTGYDSGTPTTAVFADSLLSSPITVSRSISRTSPAADLVLSTATEFTTRPPSTAGLVSKPASPWRMLRPSSVVSLAEGAGKFFVRAFRAFSASAAETVRFDLFTRDQQTTPTRLYARKRETVEQSTFSPSKPTKFIIHGFLSHQGPSSGGDALKDAFLAVQDCNVITVDWSGADTHEYSSAVKLAVPRVSTEVAEMVRLLAGQGLSLDDVHIVGHSLGGQIAGAAGSMVLGPAGAGRITALDPAGPLFENRDPGHRLDPSDAAFVDVIHTDGGYLGYAGATGHVDYFPEGGMHAQPGCGRDSIGLCSHCLAYDVIIDSLRRPSANVFRNCSSWQAFQSGECEGGSKAVIGVYADPRTRGSFYRRRTAPLREELRKAGDRDLVGLFTIRSNDGRDGVMVLQC